jgi:UTP--glucose-1-phosphate uridylyltransferase
MDLYEKYNCSILAVQEVPIEKVSSYGIIAGTSVNGEAYLVEKLVEKPDPKDAPSNLAFLGRCVLDPAIFDILDKTEPAKDGKEIQLTDAIQELAKTKAVYARKIEGKWHTVGDPLSHLKTTIEFALKRKKIGHELRSYLIDLGNNLSMENPDYTVEQDESEQEN